MNERKDKKYWKDGEILGKKHLNDLNEFILNSIANTWYSNPGITFGIEFKNEEPKISSDGTGILIPPFFAFFRSGYQVISEKDIQYKLETVPASETGFVYLELLQRPDPLSADSFKLILEPLGFPERLVFCKLKLDQSNLTDDFIYPSINLFKNRKLMKRFNDILSVLGGILNKIYYRSNNVKSGDSSAFFHTQLYAVVANVLGNLKKFEAIKICTPFDFYHHLKQIVFLVDSFPKGNMEYKTMEIIQLPFNFNNSYPSFEKIQYWLVELENKIKI